MTYLSWDLQALLILVALAGAGLIVPPVLHWVNRLIGWYRVRQYSQCYLPHSHSHTPWRTNRRAS